MVDKIRWWTTPYVQIDRRSTGNKDADVILAKRLRSSWGPHWKCETATFDSNSGVRKLLLVCKEMYDPAIGYLADRVVLHIIDLETLDALCQSQHAAGDLPPTMSLISIGKGVKVLHVTLRLPLETFKKEWPRVIRNDYHFPGPEPANRFKQVLPAVAALGSLQKTRIEIDHTDPSSWSVVDERATLWPVRRIKNLAPHIDLTLVLPNLHPFYESADYHFTESSPQTFYPIIRRVRQKYHYREDLEGNLTIIRSSHDTFPVEVPYLLLLEELSANTTEVCPERYKEMVEEERARWKKGIDVQKEVDEAMKVMEAEDMQNILLFPI
ncbi:hypothetical protein ACHAQH_009761 [Verticillium albo-atrum]